MNSKTPNKLKTLAAAKGITTDALVIDALQKHGKKHLAAKALGISRMALFNYMRNNNIDADTVLRVTKR